MPSQTGKEIRLSRVVGDGPPSLIVSADRGLALGPTPGLVDMRSGLEEMIGVGVDAITLSPGEASRQVDFFKGKRAPSLLVRSDWTNADRDGSFPLPRKETTHVSVSGAEHASYLGACGLVVTFFVGYVDDGDEADNLESVSNQASECSRCGMPLIAEARPFGERISEGNYSDSLKMAARMALEAGSDAVMVPASQELGCTGDIVEASGDAPVLLVLKERAEDDVLVRGLEAGVGGIVLAGSCLEEGIHAEIERVRNIMEGCM